MPAPASLLLPGIEVSEVQTSAILGPAFRLDAAHYRKDFAAAAVRATSTGLPVRKIHELAEAFVPGRTRLVTVENPSAGAPYLRAHDVFEIRVNSGRFVARSRVKNYDEMLLKRGMILTPSSGRNLGPMAYVGDYLSRFAMTDIMRIVPHSEDDGYYLLAGIIHRGRRA